MNPYRHCPGCGAPFDDDGDRQECRGCGFVHFRTPAVGVALVVRDGAGRVLLGRRARGRGAGLWCIPCGYLEWDEDAQVGAERELYEETGIRARAGAVIAVHRNLHGDGDQSIGIWFEANDVAGEPGPADGELTEVGYFEPSSPPPMAFPTDELVLRQLAGDG